MKRVLIISPLFPPVNAPDMQRVRMSLSSFKKFGWSAEVVAVDAAYSETVKDPLLLESIPADTKVHTVHAFSKRWTGKLGLGSIALRALWFYRKYVDRLLSREKFDLVFFSTTQFPVMILGRHWKRRFGIPYIIDMQDPWHSDYYKDKPRSQQPRKYWFSYRLNKILEPIALKSADGIMSVSAAYIETLHARYPLLRARPSAVITFGWYDRDFTIAKTYKTALGQGFSRKDNTINLVYVGRGGHDMERAARLLFSGLKMGLNDKPEIFNKFRFHFIGTSYAPAGRGDPTFITLAETMGVGELVEEQTKRIGFYQALNALLDADMLLIPGSDDPGYTASKIFPYMFAGKPLLAILHPQSSSAGILTQCNAGAVADLTGEASAIVFVFEFLKGVATGVIPEPGMKKNSLAGFSAVEMTRKECKLFNEVISYNERNAGE